VQLLNLFTLNVLLTALFASSSVALLTTIVISRRRSVRQSFGQLFLALLAFSLLGFVIGEFVGDSREAVVGTVIPAVLTLIGGVAVYVIGSKGVRAQVAVAAVLFCFTFLLLVGSLFGVRVRIEYQSELEQPNRIRLRDLGLEQNKLAVEVQRLENYIEFLKLKRLFSDAEKLDISQFDSAYEKKRSDKTESASGIHE
jgi:hypothetical protein